MRRINMAIILAASITGCGNMEAQYCSKDCKTETSAISAVQGNDSTTYITSSNVEHDSLNFDLEEPLVCLLTGAEQAERKKALQEEIFSQVKKVEEIETGYIFYFEYEEMFLMKMTDYVIAENNCCPFLTFETKLHAKDDIVLKILGSSKRAKEMIKLTLLDKKN